MKDIESIFKKAKDSKMTPEEKDLMRFRVLSYTNTYKHYKSSVLSPYLQNIKSVWNFQGFAKVTASALIVILIGAGSLTYASEQTLPGDLLYPIKIHVKEEIEVSLASTAVKKVNVQKERIEKRIEEVKEIQKTGELTEKQTETIKEAFVDQAKDLNDSFDELQASGQEEVVVAVAEDLLPTLVEFKTEAEKINTAESEDTDTSTEEEILPEDIYIATETTQIDSTEVSTLSEITEPEAGDTFAIEFQDLTSNLSEIVMIETQKIQAQATESMAVIDEKAIALETNIGTEVTEENSTETGASSIVVTKIAKTDEAGSTPLTFGVINGVIKFEAVDQDSSIAEISSVEIQKNTLSGEIVLDTNCPLGNILKTCDTDTSLYINRSVIIYNYDKTEVISILPITEKGTFDTELPIGKYILDTTSLSENETAVNMPLEVEITLEKATVIEINIDTNKTKSILQ